MAEQLVNEFTVNRPIDEAWAIITDVERIAPCLPGTQLTEIVNDDDGNPDVFRGKVRVKLGPITPSFDGQARFVERDDATHRAVIKAEGRDTGGRGSASAAITAEAEALSPTSTRCVVTTDLQITGKVAQFGRGGVIADVSEKLMDQFAGNLNTMLDESAPGDPPPDAAEPDIEPPPVGAEPGATSGPRVRQIDSPATEPVDLAGMAGPAILKRLGPVVAAVLLLLVVLRRRR